MTRRELFKNLGRMLGVAVVGGVVGKVAQAESPKEELTPKEIVALRRMSEAIEVEPGVSKGTLKIMAPTKQEYLVLPGRASAYSAWSASPYFYATAMNYSSSTTTYPFTLNLRSHEDHST